MSLNTAPTPYAASFMSLIDALEAQENLNPGPLVDKIFDRLVSLSLMPVTAQDLDYTLEALQLENRLGRLQQLSSRGEIALEEYWADRLAGASDVASELLNFPYYGEYQRLVAKEIGMLHDAGYQPRKVLFVGSGPLALSAMLLAGGHGLIVDMLDHTPAAHLGAMRWLTRMNDLGQRLHCLHGKAQQFTEFGRYDAVFLAAMVGETAMDKHAIITQLAQQMPAGQPLIIRSTHSLRQVLYPAVAADRLNGFQTLKTHHPDKAFYNSIILAVRA